MAKEQEYLWVKSPFTEHVWSLSQQAAVRPQTTNHKTAKKLEKKKEKKKPLVTTVAFQQALYIAIGLSRYSQIESLLSRTSDTEFFFSHLSTPIHYPAEKILSWMWLRTCLPICDL